jgi:hypothetical protein
MIPVSPAISGGRSSSPARSMRGGAILVAVGVLGGGAGTVRGLRRRIWTVGVR